MSDTQVLSLSKQVSNFILFASVLMVMQVAIMQNSIAGQCFSDPKKAYAYLMRQETNNKQINAIVQRSTKVNINTATEAELTTLTGIGSKKAQAIILYRSGFGRFNQVDDLAKVKGIGKKTIEKNRSRLTVN